MPLYPACEFIYKNFNVRCCLSRENRGKILYITQRGDLSLTAKDSFMTFVFFMNY